MFNQKLHVARIQLLTVGLFLAVALLLLIPKRDFPVYVVGFSIQSVSKMVCIRPTLQMHPNNKNSLRLRESSDGIDDNVSDLPPMDLPGVEQSIYTAEELDSMTVPQLKQQLRLRGMQLSGRKSVLINRLLNQNSLGNTDGQIDNSPTKSMGPTHEPLEKFVDVSEYLDENDRGNTIKSSIKTPSTALEQSVDEASPEVWGTEARLSLSEDYDDKRLVIDSISRTMLEFKGSNHSYVDAVIISTRDALRPYLRGGITGLNTTSPITTAQATEIRLREIQLKREKDAAVPIRFDDTEGLDEGDETGIFENILQREVSDWGKYTVTGAQLSAQEVKGVLLLTDVCGPFTTHTTALAEKIAFECQPAIVMVPDLFRGDPWTGKSTDELNSRGQTYEQWRSTHDEIRVSVDIRAAAACLRETYGVSSVAVWGTCYGGGRALEAASGWCPSLHDVDGATIGPPPVEPMVAVAWYPTRYIAKDLFGKHHKGRNYSVLSGLKRQLAVMGVFAGNDNIDGATPSDAAILKELLEVDDRVIDHMIKVFPEQSHGFAHSKLGQSHEKRDINDQVFDNEFGGEDRIVTMDGDAEVASLLSTAFMETYSRVFLPTVGPPICSDEDERKWGRELTIGDLKESKQRNVREELKSLDENFVEEPLLSGPRIDPTDPNDEDALAKVLRSMQPEDYDGPYKILADDDLPTIYKKLLSSDEHFQIF